MDLYLIRHADAAPLGEGGVTSDGDRPLTEAGRRQLAVLAEGLKRLGVGLDLVVTSPLVRARQTAEGMLESWGTPAPELHVAEELAPGGKRRKIAKILRKQGLERIAVVGHEPDLSKFAAWLIGGRKSKLALPKAGVAYVHFDNGVAKAEGILKWLTTQELLKG